MIDIGGCSCTIRHGVLDQRHRLVFDSLFPFHIPF